MKRTWTYLTPAYNLRAGFVIRHEDVLREIVHVNVDGNYTTVSLEGLEPFTVRSVDNLPVVSDN